MHIMRPPFLRLFLLVIGIVLTCNNGLADSLPGSVRLALDEAHIPVEHVGVVIWPVERNAPDLAIHAEQAFSPASTMKLVTSIAALGMLGPAWTWHTRILADQAPQQGILSGNLYLQGNGDPGLTDEQLYLLLHQLRQLGLTNIPGSLIIDESAFNIPSSAQPFDDQRWRAYNAAPAATMTNYDSTRVLLQRDASGKISILANHLPPDSRIINQLTSSGQACGDWREDIQTDWDAGQQALTVRGTWSRNCPSPSEFFITEQNPAATLAGAFADIWHDLGGQISQQWHEGSAPSSAIVLSDFSSQPLASLLIPMNKYSNNVMARNIWLTLAGNHPATTQAANDAVKKWLATQGLTLRHLVTENGSGLSRTARISPMDMAKLLVYAAHQPWWPELAGSLPITGVDGTMRKRTLTSAVAGHAHIKTGTLDGVKTLAGYVTLADGHVDAVVFFINDPQANLGQKAQDLFLQSVFQPVSVLDSRQLYESKNQTSQ